MPAQNKSIQSILDNLHSAVMVIDQQLSVQFMNPSAEMLFHISHARAHDQHVSKLIIDEFEFYDRLERSITSNHPYSVFDVELRTHTGDILEVDYMVSPLDYMPGRASLLLEFIPISRNKRIAVEQALLHQQEASRSLLRGLAHEIKNPLGGLRGAAQLLERELHTDADKEFTNIIIREADRLQSLVDRMLGPRTLPNKTTLNIHKVLEHVRQLVTVEHEAIMIDADYDPSLPNIYADESMLIQAVLNITRNAVAALQQKPSDGKIIFKTRTVRNQAIGNNTYPLAAKIDIIDNGEGIPDEIKQKIFLPMITGRADGTGLGLSIAQSLINEHDGLVECSSRPGNTTFTILIPLENGHE
jgi:two-component system nitrogen regulation sensor histidine kinase GlnL